MVTSGSICTPPSETPARTNARSATVAFEGVTMRWPRPAMPKFRFTRHASARSGGGGVSSRARAAASSTTNAAPGSVVPSDEANAREFTRTSTSHSG